MALFKVQKSGRGQEANHGDDPPVLFSFLNDSVWLEREHIDQVPCH